jgi:hypothetical protein
MARRYTDDRGVDVCPFTRVGGLWGMSSGCPANQTWAYHTEINYSLISQAGYAHQFVGFSPFVYIRC